MQGATTVFLSLGSNMGDRLKNLQQAVAVVNILAAVPFSIKSSAVYETAPWGKTEQPAFLNAVISFETILPPAQLLEKLLSGEKMMGRVRDEKWGPRIIDLDILYYYDQVIEQEHLHIPHPEIVARRFVLQPLCDLAPDFVHPVLKQTNSELLRSCPDPLDVHVFSKKLF
jgi:2-amino-4-hydroxy-6-hydroxymethyldihydropteridine diphosphokinase